MSERTVDALTSDALAMSERENFAAAFGLPEPESTMEPGDRTLEDVGTGLEGQREEADDLPAEPEAKPEPTKAEVETQGKERNADGRFKPQGESQPAKEPGKPAETAAERGLRAEVTAERERRRAAEQERDSYRADMDRRFTALQHELSQQKQPKEEPAKEQVPDRWTDPDGYDRWREEKLYGRFKADQQSRRQQEVRYSFQDAQAKHGEAFGEAYQAINSLDASHPSAKAILDYVMNARDPGAAVMAVHQRSKAQREIGADPAAYRQKVLDDARKTLMDDPEFRKSVLDTINAEARQPASGQAKPLTNLPPSLNTARGSSASRAALGSGSDRDDFNEAFGR